MTSRTLDSITGAKRVIIKCENFQRTGSFKFRGAWNSISRIPLNEKRKGIIAHSSGNFAQAVALVSTILKLKATIVMPNNASPSKIQATRGYGAEVVLCGNNPGDRAKMAEELVQEHDYKLVHPYDDYNVILTKAIADRLAEAFAELLHQKVRGEYWGYSEKENLSNEDLIKEKYAGIRPAPGYSAQPDHTEKQIIFSLLDVEETTGVRLTESMAMYPAASVWIGFLLRNQRISVGIPLGNHWINRTLRLTVPSRMCKL